MREKPPRVARSIMGMQPARDQASYRGYHNGEARLLTSHRERDNERREREKTAIKACDVKPTRRKILSKSGKQLLAELLTSRAVESGDKTELKTVIILRKCPQFRILRKKPNPWTGKILRKEPNPRTGKKF
eukprot:GHVU01142310.1.p2 GENE.GHVU01142310.1~~GHVU01142310.1.p2  ORF type:complete len:131 (-),score=2.66 GHVU01142310.1:265-657(-)